MKKTARAGSGVAWGDCGEENCGPEGTQNPLEPPQEEAEVESDGSEERVGAVAVWAFEVVAAHAVLGLQVADHRLDGGPALHLATDRLGHPTDLARDEDPEAVRVAVAAIAAVDMDAADGDAGEPFHTGDHGSERVAVERITVQRLACSTNWPPFGRVTGVVIDTLQPNS